MTNDSDNKNDHEQTSNKRQKGNEDQDTSPPSSSSVNPDIIAVENKFYQFGLYTGDWDSKTNKPHGQGKWYKVDTLRYDGGWDQGNWSGYSTVYDEEGLAVCTGTYLNGSLHGFATRFAEDGKTVEEVGYHVYGKERTDVTNDEEFQAAVKVEDEARARRRAFVPPPGAPSTSGPTTTKSFSFTLDKSNPIMSAPIMGLFPRYSEVSVKMLEGAGFEDLEDDEIPTPTNLEEDKTREDWLEWVRKFYPKRESL